FIHHLTSGTGTEARGGIEVAKYYEWGGQNSDNTDGFESKRPGWGVPIHNLMVENNVSILFHGHDHVFVKQELDGIIYQECPQPSNREYSKGEILAKEGGYLNGDIVNGSGHIRVKVSESEVKVDYIKAVLPEDEKTNLINGEVAYSYNVINSSEEQEEISSNGDINKNETVEIDQSVDLDTSESIQEPFVFTIVTDSHLGTDNHCDPELYEQTMKNLALDRPTLHFDLGDTFRSSKVVDPDYEKIENLYISQKPFFEYAAQSAQIYLVIGNHELEYGYLLDGTENNIPIWSTKARKLYYPNPEPDDFYTGNSREYEFIGRRQNYYAFTWRDTLFIALDPYWTTMIEPHGKNSTLWDSTIGDEQYQWLKETLEKSKAKFKFVFIHHILGETRGGIEAAKRGEWGDTINLKKYRPNWEKTIHKLIADNNVNIVFQGHDHIFVRQELDGVIYQTCPMPADPYYGLVNSRYFLTGDKIANSGHVRVAVSSSGIKVDYIRAFMPEDEKEGHKNGETAFSYTTL
ncbi:MAG: metallophosphoesterase, partial [Desulfamplus sp.]|nr:metallophosphoesterase [Desulfamplus sp.]